MANREIYPSSLFPLKGDLSAGAGATTVEVVGLQTIPFSAAPTVAGQVPTYDPVADTIDWDTPSAGNTAVTVNGVFISEDYIFLCGTAFVINYGSDDFLGIRINGTLVSD